MAFPSKIEFDRLFSQKSSLSDFSTKYIVWATFRLRKEFECKYNNNRILVTFRLEWIQDSFSIENQALVTFQPKFKFEWLFIKKSSFSDFSIYNRFWMTIGPKVEHEWLSRKNRVHADFWQIYFTFWPDTKFGWLST